jgi:hypothetical protein
MADDIEARPSVDQHVM